MKATTRLLTATVSMLLLVSTGLGCATTRQCRAPGEVRCPDGEVVCEWDTELNCEVCACVQDEPHSSDPNPPNPEHGPAPPIPH